MNLAYMKSVVEAHRNNPAALGSFRPPSLKTVIAAETVKEMLLVHSGDGPFKASMAVSVSQVVDVETDHSIFVVAFSGDHPDFKPTTAYTARLRHNLAAFAKSDGRETMWFSSDLDKVYSPMHAVSQSFYTTAFAGFAPGAAVTIAMIDGRIAEFKNLFEPNTQLIVEKKNISAAMRKAAYHGVIGGALALRMNIVLNADIPAAVRSVRGFLRYLKANAGVATKWTDLATYLGQILANEKVSRVDGPTPDTAFVAVTPATNDKPLNAAIKAANEAWGGGPFGRYCAEPKGYAAIRQLAVRGIYKQPRGTDSVNFAWLGGQLAFWYSSEGRTFRVDVVKGAEGADGVAGTGAYMVPCSSCKARSPEMLIGI